MSEPDGDTVREMEAEARRDALGSDQCCPMDTYAPGLDGGMVVACTCEHFCECMCRNCACTDWSEEEALY